MCISKAKAIKSGIIDVGKKPEAITLSDVISKYRESKRNRLKARSIEQYEYIRDHRFQHVLKASNLPHMRFHALRHINMAEQDIPTNIAQERGGWKTDSVMKSVYTHTFDEAERL